MNWLLGDSTDDMNAVSRDVNAWWDNIPSVETDEFYESLFGNTKVFLFSTPTRGHSEFSSRHGGMKLPSDVGVAWSNGANYEIWLPMKRTKAGNIVVNHWALGHELGHLLKWSLESSGVTNYGNPDDTTKKEFYEPVR